MPSVKILKNGKGEQENFKTSHLVKSVVCSALFAIVFLLIGAAVFQFFGISQKYIPVTAKIILLLSAFSGGICSGLMRKNNGYMFGAVTGLLYALLLLAISILSKMYDSSLLSTFLSVFLCVLSGAIGGILGINIKRKKKRKRNP
ncbi:MAG: TIGR04086 family membrane protein [Clostridia bacterium]|nr:TIGR04086 family membrane protein [Clostridia bacterium]